MSIARGRRGFSLLEAIVALAIVGLVGVAALAAFGAQLTAATKARATLEATALAAEQLALLRVVPAVSLNPLPDSLRHGQCPVPFADYHWTNAVEPIHGIAGLYQASVEIGWGDGEVRLTTRLYRPARPVAPQ